MATRLPTPGSDSGTWGTILNNFLLVEHTSTGALKIRTDGTMVKASGSQTVSGVKTFSSSPIVPTPTTATAAANKSYVDTQISGVSGTSPATSTTYGTIKLAGDIGGTAAVPTVPGLSSKADTSTTITAGTGLTGGGDLSASRTLSVSYGTAAGTAAQGNDSRITGAVQKSTATAKGDLLAATASATIARLGVGSDNQVLTADSAQGTGMKWADVPAAPVTSVAGRTGDVTLAESDISNLTTDLNAKAAKTTTITAGTGLSGGGDLSADRTLNVASDSTTQKVEVASGGTLQAIRKRINFIADGSVTITVADDSANNKVNVTVSDHIYVQSTQPSSPTTNDIWLW